VDFLVSRAYLNGVKSADLPETPNLTAKQVAGFLGVSVRLVQGYIKKGSMPHLRVGRLLRIPREKFLLWYEARCSKGIL